MHSQPKTRKTLNPTLVQARASEKDPMLEAKVAEARGEGWEGEGGGAFTCLMMVQENLMRLILMQ